MMASRVVRVCAGLTLSACLVVGMVPYAYADDAVPDTDVGEVAPAESADTAAPAENAEAAAPVDLSNATIGGLEKKYSYVSGPVQPKPVVQVAGQVLQEGVDYTLTYAANAAIGTATLSISGIGAYAGMLTRQFTIVPANVSVKSLKASAGRATLKWKKVPKAQGYIVQYATNKKFSKATKVKIAKAKKVKLAVQGLVGGKTYHFRIRAYAKDLKSDWTAKRVKLKKVGRKQLSKTIGKAKKSKKVTTLNTSYKLKKTKAGKKLVKYVEQLKKSYKINFVMIDLKSGEGIACSPKRSMYSASCLKGPYVASLNKWKPYSRSSSAGTMRETIVWSNNDTYSSLRNRYGSSTMYKMHKYSGVSAQGYARRYRYLSTADLAKLWVGTYWYFYKDTNKNSKWARSLYTHGLESFIYRSMIGRSKVHAKPGWYPGGGFNVQNDAGVIMSKVGDTSRPYVIACMTSACEQHAELRKLVRLIDAVHADMVKPRAEY